MDGLGLGVEAGFDEPDSEDPDDEDPEDEPDEESEDDSDEPPLAGTLEDEPARLSVR